MKDIIFEQQDLRHLSWTHTRSFSGTAGSFLKSYDDSGERKLYYKLSDYDAQNGVVGHECVNEIIAGRLMDLLGVRRLEYVLVHALILLDGREMNTFLCRSFDFKERGQSKLSLEAYYELERRGDETPLDFCTRMGWSDLIYGMIVTDFLIINRDRHGANIEVLRSRSGEDVSPAPLFDQGLSLACRCRTEEEIASFDPMCDPAVQSFVGTRSTFKNLDLVPAAFLSSLPRFNDIDLDSVLEDIDRILPEGHICKLREIIERRWEYLDSIRTT